MSIMFTTSVYSAEIRLYWDPNTEDNLAGYKLYYGNASKDYDFSVDVGNYTEYTIKDLESGKTYFISITAYNKSGKEGGFSDEMVYDIPAVDTTSPTIVSADINDSPTTVLDAFEISNLIVRSGQAYDISKYEPEKGVRVYIDSDVTYRDVPSSLKGAVFIRTANKDNISSTVGSLFLMFDINQDAIVYVAHDDRIISKPSWMEHFVDTDIDIVTTDTTLSLHAKQFKAGTIALGGNEGSRKNSMYTVIITRQ